MDFDPTEPGQANTYPRPAGTSPSRRTVVDQPTMTFGNAVTFAAAKGAKVTRKEWDAPDIYVFLKDEVLSIHNSTGDHALIVSVGDIVNVDWVVVP